MSKKYVLLLEIPRNLYASSSPTIGRQKVLLSTAFDKTKRQKVWILCHLNTREDLLYAAQLSLKKYGNVNTRQATSTTRTRALKNQTT